MKAGRSSTVDRGTVEETTSTVPSCTLRTSATRHALPPFTWPSQLFLLPISALFLVCSPFPLSLSRLPCCHFAFFTKLRYVIAKAQKTKAPLKLSAVHAVHAPCMIIPKGFFSPDPRGGRPHATLTPPAVAGHT